MMARLMRAIIVLLVALALPAPASAATRYASPSGTGDCTTAATACSFATAFNGATSGDEVVVGVGTYSGGGSFDDTGRDLTVRGEVIGEGRPVLTGATVKVSAGSTVGDLDLGSLTITGATGERVLVQGSCTIAPGGQLLDSVCGGGLSTTGTATTARTLRNVTTGTGTFSGGTTNVTSSILGGSVSCPAGATTFVNSAFVPAGGCTGTNTVAPPTYETGTFRPVAGSLTIDKGVDTGASALDLDGNLRLIGTHVDIGAYERPPVPAAVAGAQTTSTATGNTFAGTIQTGGGRAAVQFLYNSADATAVQSIPATTDATPVTATVPVLGDAPTPYRLKVTTDGGTFTTPEQIAYRAPALTPGDTTDITTTTAKLNGTVALKGAPSGTVEFVYGAATSPPQTITADGPVSAALTGLTPKTTYQWKLRVTRGSEIFETPVGIFTTAAAGATSNPTPTPSPEGSASPTPAPTASPGPPTPTFAVPAGGTKKKGQLLLDRKTITVSVRCGDVACGATASGYVTIGKTRYGTLAAPKKALRLDAYERGQITVTANRRLRQRVRRFLERHPKAVAKVHLKAVFVDADGTKVTKRATIKVRRLKR